ncbi:MAG: T9SS type A sorting domain-containing protein, partial [Proteobacteria bacterium]|nr:T9SS type A sorting domain-containing protein [Pseudomonadota bacterium]
MKRFLVGMSLLGIAMGIWAGDIWGQEMEECKSNTSYSEDSVTISISFPNPIITKVKIQSFGEFDRIKIEGLPNMNKAGEPLLPLKGIEVLLPYNKDVSEIEVSYPKEEVLEGTYTIEPAQSQYPISFKGPIKPTLPEKGVYARTSYIPEELLSEKSIQSCRGYRILPLNLHPVRYIPKFGKLYFYPYISVKIKLCKSKLLIKPYSYKGLPEDEKLIKRKVINPEVIETYPNPSKSLLLQENYKYVVITNQYLKDASAIYTFRNLIEHKIAKGITATITTTEWIYGNFTGEDTQEKIRNFIRFAHENWATDYVLLGGDTNIVPYRGLYGSATYEEEGKVKVATAAIPADLYYACLDGSFNSDGDDKWGESNDGENGGEVDLKAEVYVGRAPVDTPDEMSNFVKKTLVYEECKKRQSSYLKLAYMVGECMTPNPDEGGGCAAKVILVDQSSKKEILSLSGRFRDLLASSEKGREYVKFYYQHSPELSLIILKTPFLWSSCIDILKKSMPLIQDIVEGELKDFQEETLFEIRSMLNNIKKEASPELLRTIEQIEKELFSDKQKILSFVNSLTPEESKDLEIEPLNDETWGGDYKDETKNGAGTKTWGGDYKDEIKNGTSTNGFTTVGFARFPSFKVNTLYERDTKWSKEDLIRTINQGVHAINHMGHAATESCMKMGNADVDNLVNTEFFLGYSQSCSAGAFDENSILERFVTAEHGAFAFIGNSRYGWYKPLSTDASSQYYDRQFWDAIFGEEILNIGEAHQDSKEDNINYINENDGTMRWSYYALNLFGDPQISFFIVRDPDVDLQVIKTAPYNIEANTTLTYEILAINIGGDDAGDVMVIDDLPLSASYAVSSPSGSYDSVSHTVTWNIGTLTKNSVGTLSLSVFIPSTLTAGTQLVNKVRIMTASTETTYINNSYTHKAGVKSQTGANLGISKSATGETPWIKRGFELYYHIYYYNYGLRPATNTTVIDTLPKEVVYISSDGGIYNATNHTVSWQVGTVPSYMYGWRKIIVRILTDTENGAELVNRVSIETDTPETDYKNNFFTQSVIVGAAIDPNDKSVYPSGDIQKTEQLFYTIRYENIGSVPTTFIRIADVLDTNLDDKTLIISGGGQYSTTTRTIEWIDNLSLAPGSENTRAVSFTIYPKQGLAEDTQIKNKATIYFDYEPGLTTNEVVSRIKTKANISVFPTSGRIGTTLTVFGGGFATETVKIDFGTYLTITTVNTDTQGSFTKTFVVVQQTNPIVVITATGIASGIQAITVFTIVFPPCISNISPNVGTRGATLSLIITGSHFQTGATATMKMNDQQLVGTTTVVDTTTINVTFTLTTVGIWDVVVTNPDGQFTTMTEAFYNYPYVAGTYTQEGTGTIGGAGTTTATVSGISSIVGAGVIVPAGALVATVTITIRRMTTGQPSFSSDKRVGQVIEFGPPTLFKTPVTIILPFTQADLSAAGNIKADNLYIYWWNGTTWEKLTQGRQVYSGSITATVRHFSLFALGGTGFAPDNNNVKVYPNPYKKNNPRFGGDDIYFKGVTSGAIIKIYTITGELVDEIKATANPQGWKVSDKKLASGVYIYTVTG